MVKFQLQDSVCENSFHFVIVVLRVCGVN